MKTYEELLTDLETKLEEVWDDYDSAKNTAQGSYLLGKIRGIEYAVALLQAELREEWT